jgi:TonB family protein
MRLLVPFCLLVTAAACTSRLSPATTSPAPTLESPIADTTSSTGVYFADEVPWPATPARGNQPPRNVGAPDGEARVRFIVGTNGRAEQTTFELVAGSDRELGRRLIAAARGWKFLPAQRIDGVAVRQMIEVTVRKRREETVVDGAPVPRP